MKARIPFKGGDRMVKIEWNGPRVIILIGVLILILVSAVMGWTLIDQYLIKEEPAPARLEVEEVYFVENGMSMGKTKMDVFVFITNDGDKDCRSFIRAFAVDKDTNIAMDDSSTTETEVKGQTSNEATLTLEVPSNGKYRVELLVFKDDKITVKGLGFVDLKTGGTAGSDYRTTDEDPMVEKEESSSAIPFIGPGLIFAILAGVAIFYRRWRK
jgi:hypothetical protein